ncbi:VanZ family protein [Microbacterium horticulturae]|uniref:VanZ family protein n=1 Tax=Microbacterium horticulturae TaxID=3028316 RepID=A0ABY8BYG9_9MICO|nr:VanZ family protein [Microbacterium sp. KACC 23027]WEG07633.1 VanZ family protein [Microbacterium sp. KACC 23027]
MRVQRTAARLVLTALTLGYLWAVGWMTLRAQPYGSAIATGLDRLLQWFAEHSSTAWITFDRVEFGANVAMFVPLGILAVLWFGVRGWWTAPVIGAVVSTAIEGSQAILLSSRVADVRDIVANTLGAVIGMLLMLLLAFLLAPRRS